MAVTTTDPHTEAQAALAAMPTASLLRTAYSLTHHIHVEQDHGDRDVATSLRRQRDLIDAEVIRRAGD